MANKRKIEFKGCILKKKFSFVKKILTNKNNKEENFKVRSTNGVTIYIPVKLAFTLLAISK